jgi:hypothetical protein
VLPGSYSVVLTADGKTDRQTLTVKLDPRIHTSAADLKVLHDAQTETAHTLDQVARADMAGHSIRDQITDAGMASVASELKPFIAQLKVLLEGSEEGAASHSPGLDEVNDEAGQIYAELQQADRLPTAALVAASKKTEEEGKELESKWDDFMAREAPAINRILRQAGKPEINAAEPPKSMPDHGDED